MGTCPDQQGNSYIYCEILIRLIYNYTKVNLKPPSMKKILLFSFVLLSVSMFAQNKWNPSVKSGKGSIIEQYIAEKKIIPGKVLDKKIKTVKYSNPTNLSLVQVYDSAYFWEWNASSSMWELEGKEADFTYDANYNITGETYFGRNGIAWDKVSKITRTFDGNNNITSSKLETWNGNTWENSSMRVITFDLNNNKTSEVFQNWNGTTWENNSRNTYVYDASNNNISWLSESWISNAWEQIGLRTNTYDTQNNLINELSQHWNTNFWKNNDQFTRTYDANNNMIGETYQEWMNNAWENIKKTESTYDSNNLLVKELGKKWNLGAWDNAAQGTLSYDVNKNLTLYLFETWVGNSWKNFSLDTYQYDTNNNQISNKNESWNGSAWKMSMAFANYFDANSFCSNIVFQIYDSTGTYVQFGDSSSYYYHTATLGMQDWVMKDAIVSVYPNPTSGKITLHTGSQAGEIGIYNMIGNKVCSIPPTQGEISKEIDLSLLPKGVYVIKVQEGRTIGVKKIVLQ